MTSNESQKMWMKKLEEVEGLLSSVVEELEANRMDLTEAQIAMWIAHLRKRIQPAVKKIEERLSIKRSFLFDTGLLPRDFARYGRQLILPYVGIAGQQLLARTSILVVGAGGIGSPLLQYLPGMGIGRIGI